MPEQNLSSLLSVYYRISDAPTPEKCCSQEVCFINFLSVFKGLPITLIADNVTDKTLAFVSQPGVKVIRTSLGNSDSFLYTLDLACKADTMFAYFSEDDYIHRQEAARLIVEGLRWSNYITLYDHPDKYLKERGYGEVGRCIKSETWHWRQTISTCNTFGANLGLMRQDMDIFRKYAIKGQVPNDHATWCELAQKKRTLTASIPGAAFNTHRVSEHSGFEWGQGWAVEQMKHVVEIVNVSRANQSILQTPPEDVAFEPVDLTARFEKREGLPNLAALGRTNHPALIPPVTAKTAPEPAQAVTEPSAVVQEPPAKIRKKNPDMRPPLAIPDPLGMHTENLKKKKYEIHDGNFGAFMPNNKEIA